MTNDPWEMAERERVQLDRRAAVLSHFEGRHVEGLFGFGDFPTARVAELDQLDDAEEFYGDNEPTNEPPVCDWLNLLKEC